MKFYTVLLFTLLSLTTLAQKKPNTVRNLKIVGDSIPKIDTTKLANANAALNKPLTITLTAQQWDNVLYVIRKSHAEYPIVVQVQEWLIPDLLKQTK